MEYNNVTKLWYTVNNEQDLNEMLNAVKDRKKELKKLSSKIFIGSKRRAQIEYIKADIESAEKVCNEFIKQRNKTNAMKESTVWSDEFAIAGTRYRDKNSINNAIKYIVQNDGLGEFYQGLKPKEIEESFERIYKYDSMLTYNFKLKLEPDNEFDDKAIQVLIDGIFIGYVPKPKNKEIYSYISDTDTYKCTGFVSILGGPYKEFDYLDNKMLNKKDEVRFRLRLNIFDLVKYDLLTTD